MIPVPLSRYTLGSAERTPPMTGGRRSMATEESTKAACGCPVDRRVRVQPSHSVTDSAEILDPFESD